MFILPTFQPACAFTERSMFASAARQMGVTLPLVLFQVAIISAHQGYTNPCNELVIGGLVTTGQNIRDAMMGSYRRYGPVHHGGKVVALFAFSKNVFAHNNFSAGVCPRANICGRIDETPQYNPTEQRQPSVSVLRTHLWHVGCWPNSPRPF